MGRALVANCWIPQLMAISSSRAWAAARASNSCMKLAVGTLWENHVLFFNSFFLMLVGLESLG